MDNKKNNKFKKSDLKLFQGQEKPNYNSSGVQSYLSKESNGDKKDYTNEKLICYAQAPYNFIELSEKVVKSDLYSLIENKTEDDQTVQDIKKAISFDKYYSDRNTGYIDINITANTPIYIRDTDEKWENSKENGNKCISDFFSPAGRYRIPGSSLRGMVRTLVEILSYGKFSFFNADSQFFYRSFMDKSLDLQKSYTKRMVQKTGNTITYPGLKAGYLKKKGHNNYVMIPVETKYKEKKYPQIYRVEENFLLEKKIISEKMSKKKEKYEANERYKMEIIDILFVPVEEQNHEHNESKINIKYAKVNDVVLPNQEEVYNKEKYIRGKLICSGWVSGKRVGKHMHWIIGPANENYKELNVPHDLIKKYTEDINRKNGIDLIKLSNNNGGAPCFYITNGGGVIEAFGHTGMFRIPYKHKVGDFLPTVHKNNKIFDIPTAIFGNETDFAGRVYFEDAYLSDDSKDLISDKEETLKILSGPKPTSFQLYLTQNRNLIKTKIKEKYGDEYEGICDYNTDPNKTGIRGYKLYWHKSGKDDYIETNKDKIQKHEKQYVSSMVKTVNPGAVFNGRIRFENLTDVELGALLDSLNLKPNMVHKIGLGKPLGLGSIKINVNLHLFDIKKRYSDLLSEWDEKPQENRCVDFMHFIEKFELYILSELYGGNESDKKSFWDEFRIKELIKMLDFNNKPENKITEYMTMQGRDSQFKKRCVLQKPFDYS